MGRTRSNAATCYGGRTGRGLAKEREAEAGRACGDGGGADWTGEGCGIWEEEYSGIVVSVSECNSSSGRVQGGRVTSCSCESEFSVLLLHWIGLDWRPRLEQQVKAPSSSSLWRRCSA